MISNDKSEKIKEIWNNFQGANQMVLDTKGNELPNIDVLRQEAIKDLSKIITQFKNRTLSLGEFKTSIDSYNKKNNLWGFTAIKGQFFFNQLTKNLDDEGIRRIELLLKDTISEPKDLKDALTKIDKLEKHCLNIYSKANDKRLVANPKSVAYFLSYFWQIADNTQWPIYYTATLQSFEQIGLWEEKSSQRENYKQFYELNEEIKELLSKQTKSTISNWDVEHAFWHFRGNPNKKVGDDIASDDSLLPEMREETGGAYETQIPHLANFIKSVKNRSEPQVPVEIGHSSCVVCTLGNIAYDLGRPIKWDPVTEKFVDDAEADANRLFNKTYTEGYFL